MLPRVDDARVPQVFEDHLSAFLGAQTRRVDPDLGVLGLLVRRIDAGEVLQLAAPGFLVQPFRVATFCDGQRRVDEHLDELAGLNQLASHAPLRSEERRVGKEGESGWWAEQRRAERYTT